MSIKTPSGSVSGEDLSLADPSQFGDTVVKKKSKDESDV
jgi:hypothetical protein